MNDFVRRLIDHAALSGPFEPSRFRYWTPAERRAVKGKSGKTVGAGQPPDAVWSGALRELAPLCEEIVEEGKLRWTMRNADRTRALRNLAPRSTDLKRLWRARAPLKGDIFGRVLRDCLQDGPLTPQGYQGKDLRRAISAAIFAGAMLDGPRKDAVKRFERGLYQQAVEATNAARFQAVLPHPLCGRAPERAAMLAFIGKGDVEPPAKRTRKDTPGGPACKLLLTGSPGMGKSAFLADLVQTIGAEATGEPPWLVTFDFDQLTLTRGSVIAWAEELTRQIGTQDPGIGAEFSRIRGKHAQARSDAPTTDPEAAAGALLDEAWGVLRTRPTRRLILFADTVEEVTAQDSVTQFATAPQNTLFHQLLGWSDNLALLGLGPAGEAPFRGILTVASGRTAPPVSPEILSGWFDATMDLPELDDAAARSLLLARDPSLGPELCSRIVEAIGGHPLHLLLIQKHISTLAPDDRVDEAREIEAEGLRGAASQFVVRTLYTRFLNRFRTQHLPAGITLDDLKKLAYPGLLLRQVTAPLLSEVIGPATGIDLSDPAAAGAALAALREQVWLVTVGDAPGSVRHRPDVRRVMLPMMLDKQTGQSDDVLRRAIAWYDAAKIPRAREEAGYLRALRGDISVFLDDPSLAASVLSVTGEDLGWMPVGSQAILKYHSPQRPPLTPSEIAALPAELRLEVAYRQEGAAQKKFGGTRARILGDEAPGGEMPDISDFISHSEPLSVGDPVSNDNVIPTSNPKKDTGTNWDTIKGNWKQLKGKVKEQWGELTDDDLDQAEGQRDQLVGKIQERYGVAKDEAERQIDEWGKTAPPSRRPHDSLDWIKPSSDAYDLLNDTRLDSAIEVAFVEANFAEVSRMGWTAISRIGHWPDLTRPLGLRQEFHESWLWRTALASVVAPPEGGALYHFPPEFLGEDLGTVFAAIRDRAPLDAAIFDLDALFGLSTPPEATVSMTGEGPAPRLIPARLAKVFAARTQTIRTFRELRLLASSPFLRRAIFEGSQKLIFHIMTGAVPFLSGAFAPKVFIHTNAKAGPEREDMARQLMETIWTVVDAEEQQEILENIGRGVDSLSLEPDPRYSQELWPTEDSIQEANLKLFLRGQTPELHGTIVASLMRVRDGDVLSAMQRISEQARFWPPRLTGHVTMAMDRGGRSKAPALLRLVRYVDLCGLLPDFLRDLAGQAKTPDLIATAALFDGLDRCWSLPARADNEPAGPGEKN